MMDDIKTYFDKPKYKPFNFGFGRSTGLVEIALTTSFLFVPNFLFLYFDLPVLLMIYNFVVLFLLVSILVNKKYGGTNG